MNDELGETIVPEIIVDASIHGTIYPIAVTEKGSQWHFPLEAVCAILELEMKEVMWTLENHDGLKNELRRIESGPLTEWTNDPYLELEPLIGLIASIRLERADIYSPPIVAALARLMAASVLSKGESLEYARAALTTLAHLYGQPADVFMETRMARRQAARELIDY